jgi:hypothetical protein
MAKGKVRMKRLTLLVTLCLNALLVFLSSALACTIDTPCKGLLYSGKSPNFIFRVQVQEQSPNISIPFNWLSGKFGDQAHVIQRGTIGSGDCSTFDTDDVIQTLDRISNCVWRLTRIEKYFAKKNPNCSVSPEDFTENTTKTEDFNLSLVSPKSVEVEIIHNNLLPDAWELRMSSTDQKNVFSAHGSSSHEFGMFYKQPDQMWGSVVFKVRDEAIAGRMIPAFRDAINICGGKDTNEVY